MEERRPLPELELRVLECLFGAGDASSQTFVGESASAMMDDDVESKKEAKATSYDVLDVMIFFRADQDVLVGSSC